MDISNAARSRQLLFQCRTQSVALNGYFKRSTKQAITFSVPQTVCSLLDLKKFQWIFPTLQKAGIYFSVPHTI
jgi:hypothetical protein